MYKIALLFCSLFLSWNMQAQVGTWKTYLAYHKATIVVETPNYIFGVYDGSLLSYSPEDNEIRTYSKIQGLNDTDIRFMDYHPGTSALVLVYANSNVDIFLGENDVYNISFIINSPYYQDKTVYNLEIIGDAAYISTAFGIVVIDIKRKEVKGTYNPGATTKSVCQKGNYLFAATSEGTKRGLMTANLLDPKNWELYEGEQKYIDKLLFFNDYMICYSWEKVYYFDSNNLIISFGLSDVRSIKLIKNQLVISTDTGTYFYSDLENYTSVPLPSNSVDCINSSNQYWIAAGEEGLIGFSKLPNSSDYNVLASEIKVNSPKRNLNLYMTYTADKLLVTGGGKGADRFNTPGTLMVYENGQWYNFDENAVTEKTGLPCLDFMSVVVDPSDPMHYFVGSWGEGLYEFKDNEFVYLYSNDNSSLQTAVPNSNRFIRIDGLVFDKNNNLYMVNSTVGSGLAIFKDQKDLDVFYYPPLETSDLDKILISRNNQKWISSFRGSKAGITVIDENGTVGDSSDDKYAYSQNFVDQQGIKIDATVYLAMAEDRNGDIWVGTDNGPIFFSSMDRVDQGVCNRIISADYNNDGYRPLEGIRITSIAVDGGNRKWMGSAGSGIFVLEQLKGSEIKVDNYTSENSFLLSNNINSIAINDETGEVFIGTDKGLCSYRSEAIAGKPDYSEVYAFPNPVRPASNNQVVITGLMEKSTVKITDMAGNLISEGTSMGGQYLWNCTNRFGSIVKAGIYLVFAATPEGNQGVVTKIMVIK